MGYGSVFQYAPYSRKMERIARIKLCRRTRFKKLPKLEPWHDVLQKTPRDPLINLLTSWRQEAPRHSSAGITRAIVFKFVAGESPVHHESNSTGTQRIWAVLRRPFSDHGFRS